MIVGGYTLHLYCDSGREQPLGTVGHERAGDACLLSYPDEYNGETRAECVRLARARGWRITKGRQLCPRCREEEHGR